MVSDCFTVSQDPHDQFLAFQAAIGLDVHGILEEIGIRHDNQFAICLADMGFPDQDIFHAAINVFTFDNVANPQLFPTQDNYACEEILEHILERKADGDRCQAEARDDVRW